MCRDVGGEYIDDEEADSPDLYCLGLLLREGLPPVRWRFPTVSGDRCAT